MTCSLSSGLVFFTGGSVRKEQKMKWRICWCHMQHTHLMHFSKIQNRTINAGKAGRINKGRKKACESNSCNWSLSPEKKELK